MTEPPYVWCHNETPGIMSLGMFHQSWSETWQGSFTYPPAIITSVKISMTWCWCDAVSVCAVEQSRRYVSVPQLFHLRSVDGTYPPHIMDLAPLDFCLYGPLKKHFEGKCFQCGDDMEADVH
jgi:hypothetical protein